MEAMLAALDNLTLEAARYTEKHEREFMLVNAVLGISALGIGLYLTLYIIDVLRRRIGRLQGDLDSLQLSLASGEPITVSPATEVRYVDELGTLEQDLRAMIASLSQRFADRRAVEKSLLELATQDKLTGAGNRHKWEEQLQLELSLAARGGHFSLIMIDVDHFKRINDRHGHDVGDRVLKRMAARLRERLRSSDQLFRLGGEEFAILLRQLELTTALTLADELRALLGSDPDSALPPFSVSMGVTEYRPGDDAALLVKRADAALYAAKSQGRDCVQSA
jgi:diguanylate cyclase (GGDEF)-like protein